jgi:nucleotide-binding universal stress UspA family protein
MKKVLIAVDNTRDSHAVLSLFSDLVSLPESTVLLHVQQLEGNTLMTGMLGEAEMSTLKEALEGSEHKEVLDRRAEKVLAVCKEELEKGGLANVKTVVKAGHPAEEILRAAEEEGAEMIVMGCSGKSWMRRLITGCVSREVEKGSRVPVMITKGKGCGDHAHLWSRREAYAIR